MNNYAENKLNIVLLRRFIGSFIWDFSIIRTFDHLKLIYNESVVIGTHLRMSHFKWIRHKEWSINSNDCTLEHDLFSIKINFNDIKNIVGNLLAAKQRIGTGHQRRSSLGVKSTMHKFQPFRLSVKSTGEAIYK